MRVHVVVYTSSDRLVMGQNSLVANHRYVTGFSEYKYNRMEVLSTMAVHDQSDISFRSLNGHCRGNQFLLALSTILSSADVR